MLVAILALFLAVGGVGYAATTIGSAQIKNNSIRSGDVRNGTIMPKDLSAKTRSLIRTANGARGNTGARGLEGATGPVGPAAAAGATNVVARTNSVSVPCQHADPPSSSASPGERATGGGGGLSRRLGPRILVQSGPVDASGTFPIASGSVPTGWRVEASNNTDCRVAHDRVRQRDLRGPMS